MGRWIKWPTSEEVLEERERERGGGKKLPEMNTELTACCKPWRTFFIPARCKATCYFHVWHKPRAVNRTCLRMLLQLQHLGREKKGNLRTGKLPGMQAGAAEHGRERGGSGFILHLSLPPPSFFLCSPPPSTHDGLQSHFDWLWERREKEGGDTGKGREYRRCGRQHESGL